MRSLSLLCPLFLLPIIACDTKAPDTDTTASTSTTDTISTGSSGDAYELGYADGKAAAEADFEDRLAQLEAQALTAADLDGYATETWVNNRGFGATDDIDANTAAIDAISADYVTSGDLSGFATEIYVDSVLGGVDLSSYLTNADLMGLASETYVDSAVSGVSEGIAGLSDYLSVDTATDSVIFEGANVYVQSGQGTSSPSSPNGTGNLILGYDEDDGADSKIGSHNLVVGPYHSYTNTNSLVSGYDNSSLGDWTVAFGYLNTVEAQLATVTGGQNNTASGLSSSIAGGIYNTISSDATHGSINGGYENAVTGAYSSIAGGVYNTVSGTTSVVSGGYDNLASGSSSAIAGGGYNEASAQLGTVGGGYDNHASGVSSHVAGGRYNESAHNASVVAGGNTVTTSGEDDVAF